MKKITATAAAVVTALTMTGCGKNITIQGASAVYSGEDILSAVECIEDVYLEDNTDMECQFLGDITYDETEKYVKKYHYYNNDKDTKDISGDYLAFRVTIHRSKTPSNIIKAIGGNLFDINGFRKFFGGGWHECVVEKDENGEWKYLGDFSDYYGGHLDDATADGISDIYSSAERETALDAMTDSGAWADLDADLLYAKYAGDESASKEELDKLNKRNGTAYDECMVMYADLYSCKEQTILKDTKWQLAKDNGVWKVVEYSTSERENK
jgi:hypothetical protein